MTHRLLKRVIESGNFNAANIMEKLDVYLAFDRITKEQYEELAALITTNE